MEQYVFIRRRVGSVQTQKPGYAAVLCQNPDRLHVIDHLNTAARHFPFQHFSHHFGRIRAGAGRPGSGIMIRFISDKFAVRTVGKRNAEFHQVVKAPRRKSRLAQRLISIDAAGLEQILRHTADTVRIASRDGQLVVGLLVRSGIPGSSGHPVFRDQRQIAHAKAIKSERSRETGRAASDNYGVQCLFTHDIPPFANSGCKLPCYDFIITQCRPEKVFVCVRRALSGTTRFFMQNQSCIHS